MLKEEYISILLHYAYIIKKDGAKKPSAMFKRTKMEVGVLCKMKQDIKK